MDGWAGFKLVKKTQVSQREDQGLGQDSSHFGKMWTWLSLNISKEIQLLDLNEDMSYVSGYEISRRHLLKEAFQRKVTKEEIKWKQRSHCKWHEGGKFFHGMASTRLGAWFKKSGGLTQTGHILSRVLWDLDSTIAELGPESDFLNLG